MKAVKPEVQFPEMEREILALWQSEKTFEESNSQRKGKKEFAFYDGPPFANGLPHYGHILANAIKDSVPRYWNMRGFYVERRFGWDCHGVPVEYEIEKRDNLKGRGAILEIGVAEFNRRCRESVMRYAEDWEKIITRLGRWVDWKNQYRTMDKSFMESVWWVFSELYRKNFVYRGFKVVAYSPRLTAVLSNFEANQNYKDTQDPAVTVKFKLKNENAFILAWTTTPWTLISNLALCVGAKIDYVKIKDTETNEIYYLAEARLDAVYKKGKTYEVLGKVKGTDLKGKLYEPLFPYFANQKNAFKVLADDYVSTGDGTGVVHQAPAFGEDDFRICTAAGIPFVDPLDEEAKFKAVIPEFQGQFVKDADKEIIKTLKAQNKILRHETLVHSYPFCERTDGPLIYRAIPAWYVAVEKFADRLVANNKKINWVPNHLRDGRFGNWLENARDWAISRNRYWGTPLPIWVNDANADEIEIFGSVGDLEKRAGVKLDDVHKQFIDTLTFPAKSGKGTMRRVPEVFDCWFESGSMPYAQLHYPFENQKRFEEIFPADFIAEGLDQTRGWFYTLMVLSTALFDKPAFKNVIVNGIILDETGKKMSKRHRNYTSPTDLLEKYGADATRLYMFHSPILRAEDLIFTDKGVLETIRAVLLPLWNSHSFLTTYANADGWVPTADLASGKAPKSTHELDRWIISRLNTLAQGVHEQMECYKMFAVVPLVLQFIDDLTNWYIRLNRRRFWSGSEEGTHSKKTLSQDSQHAYQTLYYVLAEFSKIFAPFAPFMSDRIYRNLVDGVAGAKKSVHLCDMPVPDAKSIDSELESRIALIRTVTDLGRSLRAKHQLKTRQPLASLLVITRNPSDQKAIEEGLDFIRNELNVKEIKFTTDEASYVRLGVKPNLKTLGKRLGGAVNDVRKILETTSQSHDATVKFLTALETQGSVEIAGHKLVVDDFLIDRGPKDDRLIATQSGVTVLLDTKLTDALVLEGLAREFVNRVQNFRKDSGLAVSDRIHLQILAQDPLKKSLLLHKDYITQETLARSFDLKDQLGGPEGFSGKFEIDAHTCDVRMSVANT